MIDQANRETPAEPVRPGIRVLRLSFHLWVAEPLELSERTGSTLRGFLKLPTREALCVTKAPECKGCPVLERCGYGVIWERPPSPELPAVNEPQAAILPVPMETGQRVFRRGDGLVLSYTLLGVGTEFVPHVVRGMEAACQRGLGLGVGRLLLKSVLAVGDRGRPAQIYDCERGFFNLHDLKPAWRELPALDHEGDTGIWQIEAQTPLHLRAPSQKVMLDRLDPVILTLRMLGRLKILSVQLEGQPVWKEPFEFGEDARRVEVLSNGLREVAWRHWSGTQRRQQPMEGMIGHAVLGNVTPRLGALWRLAEDLHVGRHTHFGLGRIRARRAVEGDEGAADPVA